MGWIAASILHRIEAEAAVTSTSSLVGGACVHSSDRTQQPSNQQGVSAASAAAAAACCPQLHGRISMFLSHDWPNLITNYGDSRRLFSKKPYFQKEVSETRADAVLWAGQQDANMLLWSLL